MLVNLIGKNMKITHPFSISHATLAITLLSLSTANASLEPRLGGQAIYDTDLNVTWLADANLAATNTFGVQGISLEGLMSWDTAQRWIRAMNATNYLGYHDWKLPTTPQPDATCYEHSGAFSTGHNCTGSMMGHLFYTELGGDAHRSIITNHNAGYSLFKNVEDQTYWSETSVATWPGCAWAFVMNGIQFYYDKRYSNYAWPIRNGDVAGNMPYHAKLSEINAPHSIPKMLSGSWTLDLKATEKYITSLPRIENPDQVAQGMGLAGGFLLGMIYEFNGTNGALKTFNPSISPKEFTCLPRLPLRNGGIRCSAKISDGRNEAFNVSILDDNAIRIIFPREPELNYLVWTREELDPRQSVAGVIQERIKTSKEPFEHIMKYLNSQTTR